MDESIAMPDLKGRNFECGCRLTVGINMGTEEYPDHVQWDFCLTHHEDEVLALYRITVAIAMIEGGVREWPSDK